MKGISSDNLKSLLKLNELMFNFKKLNHIFFKFGIK
jgi:hypothetical protein